MIIIRYLDIAKTLEDILQIVPFSFDDTVRRNMGPGFQIFVSVCAVYFHYFLLWIESAKGAGNDYINTSSTIIFSKFLLTKMTGVKKNPAKTTNKQQKTTNKQLCPFIL